MNTKSKVIFKITILFAILLATFFAGFSVINKNDRPASILKNNNVSAVSNETMYYRWYEKLSSKASKGSVVSILFTNNRDDVPDDNLITTEPISVGASDEDGEIYNASSSIEAYIQRAANYYQYNIIVYSPNYIYAPKNCTNFFSNFGSSSNTNVAIMLKNFNTSNTINMSNMFGDSYFREIDFSNCNFNTLKVTNMARMFYACRYLSKLDLSTATFNTSNVESMSNMFYNNNFETAGVGTSNSLNFGSNFKTSNVKDMSYMFGCYSNNSSSIKKIDLSFSNFDTSSVTDMKGMFAYCYNLTDLLLNSKFDTSSVTDMSNMFMYCRNLKKLNLASAKFSTENVKNMTYMFSCTGFSTAGKGTQYDLNFGDKFNISSANNLSYMFGGFYNSYNTYATFTSIDLSSWIVPQVKINDFNVTFNNMFYYCKKLTSVNFGNGFKVDNVNNMSYMFSECSALSNVEFGSNFIPYSVKNFSFMFNECNKIVGVDLTYFKTTSATDMSYMFYDCYSLTSLDLRAFNTSKVVNMSYMFAVEENSVSRLSNLTLNFDTGNVTNMSHMFQYCQGLTSLELSSFNTSKVVNMSYMFDGCLGLSSVGANNSLQPYALNFGNNFYTSNVTNMAYMFNDCKSSSVFDLSIFDTQKVTDMRYMFQNCNTTKKIVLGPRFLTDNVTNMTYMFANCSSLKEDLDLTLFNTDNIESTEKMFYNCSSIRHIIFGDEFTIGNVTDMQYMFCNCSSLEELDVSNFSTTNVTDMRYLFANCSTLTELDLKNFDTSKVTSMWSMFSGCSSFESAGVCTMLKTYSLNFGDNFYTSLVTDMSNMFAYCQSLREISFGTKFSTASVENFSSMFFNCSSLLDLSTISNFNTNSLKDMSSMFGFCSSLTTIDLNKFRIKSGMVIIGLLDACSNLETIIAPNIEATSQITADLPTVFTYNGNNYTQLSKNTSGKRLTRAGIFLYSSFRSIIGEEVCQKVATITTTNNLQNSAITQNKYNTLQLLTDAATGGIYSVGTGNTSGTLYNNTSPLKAYLVKSDYTNEAGDELFDCIIYCPNQLNIYAPASCVSIFAANDDYGTFFTNLQYVYLDNFNTNYTTSMAKMFENCSELLSLTLNTLNVSSVNDFEDMLMGCEKLAYIYTFRLYNSDVVVLPGAYYNTNRTDTNVYLTFPSASVKLARQFMLKLDITSVDGVPNLPASWSYSEEGDYIFKPYFFNEDIGTLPTPALRSRVFDAWGNFDEDENFVPFTAQAYNYIDDIMLAPSWKKVYIEFDLQSGKIDATKVAYFTTKTVDIENDDGTTTTVQRPQIDLQDIPENWEDNFVDGKMYVYVGEQYGLLPNAKFSYYFTGWYYNNSYVKSTNLIPNSSTGTIKLVAGWSEEANEEDKVVITFNANGGVIDFRNGVVISLMQNEENPNETFTNIEVIKCEITWVAGSGKDIATIDTVRDIAYDNMPNATFRKHKFLGWFTQQYGGKQVYSTDIIEGSITLYAQWETLEDPININAQILIYVFCGIAIIVAVSLFFAFTRRTRNTNKSITVNEKFINEYNNMQNDDKSNDNITQNDDENNKV